jgi:flagellar biosynthetic protein FliP
MSAEQTTTSPRRARPVVRFTLHFLEMVVAMVVGMVVLGPIWSFTWPGLSDVMTAQVLVMATNMSLGMALWMRIRRHGWASIVEMSAAMYVPFLVLLPFHWAGVLAGMTLMGAGHVLMLPAMLIAMLRRRHEYSC